MLFITILLWLLEGAVASVLGLGDRLLPQGQGSLLQVEEKRGNTYAKSHKVRRETRLDRFLSCAD
jgi:hypothetical protein